MSTLITVGILMGIYFLPTIVAGFREHEVPSVFVVNLFLGWTFIGWVVALAMAVRGENKAKARARSGVGRA